MSADASGAEWVTVTTPQGLLRGVRIDGVAVFRGVAYAAAPVGERRFRAPEPVAAWNGVRDATVPGPTAPQPGYPPPLDQFLPNPRIGGEEYLNLTVWTPDPGAAGLPVLVWIHGGAFVNGSGVVPVTDGTAFARSGIVTVAINYRLGVEGFALLPDAPANRGLLDQIAALEWVRDTITAFGGDPAMVTVAGQSSGAMCIATLLAVPRAAGLFRRAILQSGAAHHSVSAATGARVADRVAAELGVPATAAALRALPVGQVLDAQQAVFRELQTALDPAPWGELAASRRPFAPVVDGEVLPAPPLSRIAAGAADDVGLLVGTNQHEYRLYLVPTGAADKASERTLATVAAQYRLPLEALDRYRAADPAAGPGTVLADVMTDWFYRVPALRLAEAHTDCRVYEFGWESPVDGLGACHMLEAPFVFDTVDGPAAAPLVGPTPPRTLAGAMHRAWVAFTCTGDPGWPSYTPDRRLVGRFDSATQRNVEVVDDPRADLRKLWEGVR